MIKKQTAEELLDMFSASRKCWFGNYKDFKTWKSIKRVLYSENPSNYQQRDDNSFIHYLELLANISVEEIKLAREDERKKTAEKIFKELYENRNTYFIASDVSRSSVIFNMKKFDKIKEKYIGEKE